MKKIVQKVTGLFLSLTFLLACSVVVFAAPSDTKVKQTSEFGRLTGYVEYAGKASGRKYVNFWTEIQRLSTSVSTTRIYASVDIKNYLTGEQLDQDNAMILENKTKTGYSWEGRTDQINNTKLAAFGTHEARGYGSEVVYTDIHDF